MLSRRSFFLATVAVSVATATATSLLSNAISKPGTPLVFTGIVKGVAVGGYDPVAYFTSGQPVRGDKAITLQHDGATWRFASAANRDAFKADPVKYAPAYGGHCAWAVSQGYTAKGDPNAWKIVKGRLYLNYNKSVQKTWEKNIPSNISKADKNWPKLTS